MKTILAQTRSFLHLLRTAFLGKEKTFTTGGINRAIVLLSVPMVMELLMESLFVCTNLFFVSRMGAGAVAIVGTAETVVSFVYSVSIGLSIAASAMVSRRVGEKQFETAGLTAMQIIYVGLVMSFLLSTVLFVFNREVLSLAGIPTAMLQEADVFSRLMFGSVFFLIMRITMNGVFRGAGDAATAMRTLWLSNTINILLCPLLIFGWGPVPALGLAGVALAAVIARVVGVLYQVVFLAQRRSVLVIGKAQLVPSPEIIRKVVKLAFAGTLQYMIPSSSWLLMIRIISHFGSDALAGYVIAQRIGSVVTMPAWGIGNAAGILTGQNIGANQVARAEASVWKAGLINTCFLGIIAVVWQFYAVPVVGLFTSVPAVSGNAVTYLHYISVAYVLLGYTMVISRALNAAGEVTVVSLLYILMFYLTQIPLSYLLGIRMAMGPDGIFLAILVSEIVLASACIIVFRKGRWKYRKL
ncbi:MATE family efflux transporter [Chitinophaga sp. OAE865]|uniref:MATE family efflux transporter n=1 Tax=Chitinophaga sp. OAE865 TaxID=2817898 RepID=UPI001AE55928